MDSNFAPVLPPEELEEAYASSYSGPLAPLGENITSSINRKYIITYCTVVREGGPSHGHRWG